jgi:hypothetical protein
MTEPRGPIGKPKPRRGRPPKLTSELQAEWVRLAAEGLSPIEAARSLEIPDRTRRAWMARGRGDGRTAGAQTPALEALVDALDAAEVTPEVLAWSLLLSDHPGKFLERRGQNMSKRADRELTRELAGLPASKRRTRSTSVPNDEASEPATAIREPSGRGRPPTLTPQIAAKLVRFVSAGAPPIVAARALHIPDRTFRAWMARGRGEGGTAGAPTPATEALVRALEAAEARTFGVAFARLYQDDPGRWLRMNDDDEPKHADRALRRELAEIRARNSKADPPAPTAIPVERFVSGIATAQEMRELLEIMKDDGVFDDLLDGRPGAALRIRIP